MVDNQLGSHHESYFREKERNESKGRPVIYIPRDKWGSSVEYIVVSLCYITNLSSWRYTLLSRQDGGGWFMLMYIIVLIIFGGPLFLMESVKSQYTSVSLLGLFARHPFFKGIGYCMLLTTCCYILVNNTLLSWTLIYLYSSCRQVIPWTQCNQPWNDFKCELTVTNCTDSNFTQADKGLCVANSGYNPVGIWNLSEANRSGIHPQSAVEQFFIYEVSQAKSGIGVTTWHLNTCLMIVTVLGMIGDIIGIKSSGKLIYLLFGTGVILLLVMFFHATSRPEASAGLLHLAFKDSHHLYSLQSWILAGLEAIHSLGVGTGVVHMISSHNQVHSNSTRNTLIIMVGALVINIISGLTISAWSGSTVDLSPENDYRGVLVPFISVPTWLYHLQTHRSITNIFYLYIFVVGIGAQMLYLETIVISLSDEFSWINERKVATRVFVSAVTYSLSLTAQCGVSGLSLMVVLDYLSSGYLLIATLALEIILCCLLHYGADRMKSEMKEILSVDVRPERIIFWAVLSCLYILMIFLVYMTTVIYTGIETELSARVITILPIVILSCIPLYMLYSLFYSYDEGDDFLEILNRVVYVRSKELMKQQSLDQRYLRILDNS